MWHFAFLFIYFTGTCIHCAGRLLILFSHRRGVVNSFFRPLHIRLYLIKRGCGIRCGIAIPNCWILDLGSWYGRIPLAPPGSEAVAAAAVLAHTYVTRQDLRGQDK